METRINRARTQSAKFRQVVRDMTAALEDEQHQHRETLKKLEEEIKDLRKLLLLEKVVDGTKAMETRVQEIETTLKLLKESTENSVKNAVVQKTEHLMKSVCDQMEEDFRTLINEIFEKMSEEHKESVAKLTDYNNNAELQKTAGCEQGMCFNSPREGEFAMVVDTLSSSERQENATLPVDLKQSKSEGKFALRVFLQITNTWDQCVLMGPSYKCVALENYSLVWKSFYIIFSIIIKNQNLSDTIDAD